MKIYQRFNEYGQESFDENLKFSCHNWLMDCIENLDKTQYLCEQNQYNLNQRDLTGKYNSLNFLIDVFHFYQMNRSRGYPSNRSLFIDFNYISSYLIENGADIQSPDYQRKSVIDNLKSFVLDTNKISWKEEFANHYTLEFLLSSSLDFREFRSAILYNHSDNPVYINLFLENSLNITDNKRIISKI